MATKTKKAVKKVAAPTNSKAARKRREWSKADLAEINRFAVARRKDKSSAPWKGKNGITTKLGRSEGAIRQKCHAEGIALS